MAVELVELGGVERGSQDHSLGVSQDSNSNALVYVAAAIGIVVLAAALLS